MHRYSMAAVTLGALIAVSVAGLAAAGKPVMVQPGKLEFIFGANISPKALSRTEQTPAALTVSGKVRTTDGSQPPALRELIVDADRNGEVSVKGYPVCTPSGRQVRDPEAVEAACKSSIVGKGSMTVSVKFPEQAPVPAKSPLLVFNGGEKRGVITLYVHAFLTQPITTAVVTTLKIAKERKGRFATRTVASIPTIANGAGSVTDFSLVIDKKFTYKGKKVSVLSAKCSDGKLLAHGTAIFRDTPPTEVSAEILSTCTPKG